MLSKLAFKNVGKSIKDYLIYFFTLALGVCVFYMFNSIHAQQAMMNLTLEEQSASIKAFKGLLSYVSAFVVVVLGFLIVYANNFFIKRRKKELGIYMTLGMEKRSISVILGLETSLIALISLIAGLALGITLSQFMSFFTAKIFEADLTNYSFVFSMTALLKSIGYFACIFLIVILCNAFTLRKYKLIDLIYDERKNESLKIRNPKVSAVLFVLSLCILAAAYYLILKNGIFYINAYFFISVVLGTIGTLLFFYTLSGLLTVLIQRSKRIYYNNLNMFVVRQLASKINTNFVSISVVCLVLLLTIGIFSTGYSMQGELSSELRAYAEFDYSFTKELDQQSQKERPFGALIDFLNHNENVKEYGTYTIFRMEQTYGDFGIKMLDEFASLNQSALDCMALSDYNAMLKLQGKSPVLLADNEYALLTNYKLMTEYAKKIVSGKVPLTMDGMSLRPVLSQTGSIRNGMERIMVIVPDRYTLNLPCQNIVLNVNCSKDKTEQFEEQLKSFVRESSNKGQEFDHYSTRAELYAGAVTNKAMLSFISIYLGIVFMMTCAAILAIQQLTDAADNSVRYELLEKLGADQKTIMRALFLQILCYFVFPFALAIIHSIFGLMAANDALKTYGNYHIGSAIAATAAFVGILYVMYFLLTYVGSKAVIHKTKE